MDASSKVLQVSDTISYRYLFHAPGPDKPTLLFLHGFPSLAQDWSNQIAHFASEGYGVVAPDLLGYGGTSKPEDYRAYSWRAMSAHIKEILDAENTPQVVGVGHDLGCWFLSRLYHFYSGYFRAVVFLDVGYSAPGDRFDVEMINRLTKQMTGEEKFRYWDLFTSDEGVAAMDKHPASVVSLLHADPAVMAQNMGPPGKAFDWVTAGRVEPKHSGETETTYFKDKVRIFGEGGFTGPTNWYRALRENISYADEEHMPKTLTVPTLLIGCEKDEMTQASFQDELTRPWAKAMYRFEALPTGHWPMLEDAGGTNRLIHDFLTQTVNQS